MLRSLGYEHALCFPWPCDDETALVLLATLNRLEGEDVPARRAELLVELTELIPAEELAAILPEDARAIDDTLALLDLDADALLAELTAEAERAATAGPRLASFALTPEDEAVVEQVVTVAMDTLAGNNRRGRALALICRSFLDEHDG